MQIIKIFILGIILLSSSFIGRILANKFKNRLEELKEMKNTLNIFKTKIKFTYEPIPIIFEEISKSSKSNIGKIFETAQRKLKDQIASKSWNEAIEETNSNLTQNDKETLKMFSKMLGETDLEGQISQINITLSFLDKQIQEAETEKNKNEKLYKKLGTIMGLALVIILF